MLGVGRQKVPSVQCHRVRHGVHQGSLRGEERLQGPWGPLRQGNRYLLVLVEARQGVQEGDREDQGGHQRGVHQGVRLYETQRGSIPEMTAPIEQQKRKDK